MPYILICQLKIQDTWELQVLVKIMRFCVQRKLYNDSAVHIYEVSLFVLQQVYRGSKEKSESMLSTTDKKPAQRWLRFRHKQPASDNIEEVEKNQWGSHSHPLSHVRSFLILTLMKASYLLALMILAYFLTWRILHIAEMWDWLRCQGKIW